MRIRAAVVVFPELHVQTMNVLNARSRKPITFDGLEEH